MSVQKKSSQVSLGRMGRQLFWALSSLKAAVLVILGLAIALAVGTILESVYDTPTSQYWVYRSIWFHALLAFLGVNIFFVALSRYPWRKRHIPFLLAHLGILILLAGSWITDRSGLDGNLRVTEGETASVVELDQASFILSEKDRIKSIPVPWVPPGVSFLPIDVARFNVPYDIKIDQFLSHADGNISFVPDRDVNPRGMNGRSAAIQVRMVGGPMGVSEELWLWEGSPSWRAMQAGPSRLMIGEAPQAPLSMAFLPQENGDLHYQAISSAGKKVQGRLKKDQIVGQVIHPGWKGDVHFTVVQWVPVATPLTTYKAARIQSGPQAPASAIHVVSKATQVWLGLGDRAILHFADREVEIGYFPKRFVLPFSVKLNRFLIEHDQGTYNPASYASEVVVSDGKEKKSATISMNEPLDFGKYTLYQASYEDAEPRPITSVFSINRDPGRPWKYLGSLLIVLGSVLLFAAKYRSNRKSQNKKKQSVVNPEVG